jgi:hypothetical protein
VLDAMSRDSMNGEPLKIHLELTGTIRRHFNAEIDSY